MAGLPNAPSGHDVAGLYTQLLLKPLIDELGPEPVEEIIRRAGDPRSLEALCDGATWSSFDQFQSLLLEVKQSLETLSRPGVISLGSLLASNTELIETAQTYGSPRDLFVHGGADNPLLPIRRYETTEIGSNEWTIRESFADGFEPYREFCEFAGGLLAVIPMVFGLPPAAVIEEECQCRGDATCLFRVSWQSDDDASRIEFLEMRNRLLEVRLEQLHGMIEDLATNERYEDVLQRIVSSSFRAVGAGGALLTVEGITGGAPRLYSLGFSDPEAADLAEQLLHGEAERPDVFVVDVASARRRFGVLAVDGQGGVFAQHSQDTLRSYARLAAAALDSADALETARHEANTAQVLLDLSRSLAAVEDTDEMVSRVVKAVPEIVDCDRAALFLTDPSPKSPGRCELRLAASSGYPEDAIASLASLSPDTPHRRYLFSQQGIASGALDETGAAASIAAPLRTPERIIGFILAEVSHGPERLAVTTHLGDRLVGLAAQAAIAISNARLLDQIRFQAVHDGLTGLPNRSLMLEQTEEMLTRARSGSATLAALFIDLDGFKDVNDTFGHGVGDRLLRAVTTRLTRVMRAGDILGRIGGDEFLVLVGGSEDDPGPELIADRLLSVLRDPFVIEGAAHPLTITASIGIAAGHRDSVDELICDADMALYRAKGAGKDRFARFESVG